MMGGIEWGALPAIVEILGIDDVELCVRYLGAIRKHENQRAGQ